MSWRFTLKSGWQTERECIIPVTTRELRYLSWPWVAGLLACPHPGACTRSCYRRCRRRSPATSAIRCSTRGSCGGTPSRSRLPNAYWNAPAFAPMPRALALSETLLGLTWLTTPLQWFGASPVLAYNVLFIALPVLNGLSAYWLCLVLTGRRDAATIGALAFALAPYHADQLSHIQTEALFFMPIAAGALHRYWTTSAATLAHCARGRDGVERAGVRLLPALLLDLPGDRGHLADDLEPVISRRLAAVLAALALAVLSRRSGDRDVSIGAERVRLWRGANPRSRFTAPTRRHRCSARIASPCGRSAPTRIIPGRRPIPAWRSSWWFSPVRPLAVTRPHQAGLAGRIAAGALRCSRSAIVTVLAGATVIPRPHKVISIGLYLGLIARAWSRRQFRALVRSASMPTLYAIGLVAAAALSRGTRGPRVRPSLLVQAAVPVPDDSCPALMPRACRRLFSSIEILCLAVLAAFAITRLWPAVTRASLVAIARNRRTDRD